MKYMLTLKIIENNNGSSHTEINESKLDSLIEAKASINQLIIALNSNVEKKCAQKVILNDWTTSENNTLIREFDYIESEKFSRHFVAEIKEKSFFG